MKATDQVVVVGAGPAGLSATLELLKHDARVLLIDFGERPGGNYWRHPADSELPKKHEALRVVADPRVEYLPRTSVLDASHHNGTSVLTLMIDGKTKRDVTTRLVIIASGAFDRSLPFPGWDLPGVMTAGGVQALLKAHKTPAGKHLVVAGTGPFLLPVAVGLIMAGVEVKAIIEASRPSAWVWRPRAFVNHGGKLKDFFIFRKIITKAKVPTHYGRAVVSAHGNGSLERVVVSKVRRNFRLRAGRRTEIECDVLAVSWGFTPDVLVGLAVGCASTTDARDGSTILVADDAQQTSLPGVFAAGEVTGIGGSAEAMTEGRLAGISAALALGLLKEDVAASERAILRRSRRKQHIFASGLLAVYKVASGWMSWQQNDTVVCRCQEVTFGEIGQALSVEGARDLKRVCEITGAAGGPCQGQVCRQPIESIIAAQRNK